MPAELSVSAGAGPRLRPLRAKDYAETQAGETLRVATQNMSGCDVRTNGGVNKLHGVLEFFAEFDLLMLTDISAEPAVAISGTQGWWREHMGWTVIFGRIVALAISPRLAPRWDRSRQSITVLHRSLAVQFLQHRWVVSYRPPTSALVADLENHDEELAFPRDVVEERAAVKTDVAPQRVAEDSGHVAARKREHAAANCVE